MQPTPTPTPKYTLAGPTSLQLCHLFFLIFSFFPSLFTAPTISHIYPCSSNASLFSYFWARDISQTPLLHPKNCLRKHQLRERERHYSRIELQDCLCPYSLAQAGSVIMCVQPNWLHDLGDLLGSINPHASVSSANYTKCFLRMFHPRNCTYYRTTAVSYTKPIYGFFTRIPSSYVGGTVLACQLLLTTCAVS